MLTAALAQFRYLNPRSGRAGEIRTVAVRYGASNLQAALAESLYSFGLSLPEPVLTINKDRHAVTISSQVFLGTEAPSVSYTREYPPQDEFAKLVKVLDRTIEYICRDPKETASRELDLPGSFEHYLIENMRFNEEVVFRKGNDSAAKIRGYVIFSPPSGAFGAPDKREKYDVNLDPPYVQKISQLYRQCRGKDISDRSKKHLRGEEGSLDIEGFLKYARGRPSRRSHAAYRSRVNTKKSVDLLTAATFSDLNLYYAVASDSF